jgi:hypothetical protein
MVKACVGGYAGSFDAGVVQPSFSQPGLKEPSAFLARFAGIQYWGMVFG